MPPLRPSHLIVPALLGASLLLGAADPKDKDPKKIPAPAKAAPAEATKAKPTPPKADKAKSLKPKPKGGVADDTI